MLNCPRPCHWIYFRIATKHSRQDLKNVHLFLHFSLFLKAAQNFKFNATRHPYLPWLKRYVLYCGETGLSNLSQENVIQMEVNCEKINIHQVFDFEMCLGRRKRWDDFFLNKSKRTNRKRCTTKWKIWKKILLLRLMMMMMVMMIFRSKKR